MLQSSEPRLGSPGLWGGERVFSSVVSSGRSLALGVSAQAFRRAARTRLDFARNSCMPYNKLEDLASLFCCEALHMLTRYLHTCSGSRTGEAKWPLPLPRLIADLVRHVLRTGTVRRQVHGFQEKCSPRSTADPSASWSPPVPSPVTVTWFFKPSGLQVATGLRSCVIQGGQAWEFRSATN